MEHERPDLKGPRPDDWDPTQWAVAVALQGEVYQTEVADDLGVSVNTIKRWVKRWRDTYGRDFIPSRSGLTAQGRAMGAAAGGKALAAEYEGLRRGRAAKYGDVAAKALELAEAAIVQHLTASPVVLSIDDIERLAKAAQRLTLTAERLVAPVPGSSPPPGGGTGAVPPEGLLDGLETKPGDHATIRERMEVIVTSYQARRDVVDVSEAGEPS